MIVPMKKIAILVLDRERRDALKALRALGVVHLEKREASSADLADLQSRVSRLDAAQAILLEAAKNSERDRKAAKEAAISDEDAMALAERAIALGKRISEAREAIRKIDADLERFAPWGELDPESFAFLSSRGIDLRPCEMPAAEASLIPDTVQSMELARDRKRVFAVLLTEGPLDPAILPAGARLLSLPAVSTAKMREERGSLVAEIESAERALSADSRRSDDLARVRRSVAKDLEFEAARAGMREVSFGEASEVAGNSGLAWLSGFVPAADVGAVTDAAKERGWAFLVDDPSEEDLVPTKIKNNPAVGLIKPLLDFLGIVPGYHEIDISGWFILFFGLFFAMIFGDGGYGAIIAVISVAGILANVAKGKKVPTAFFMFLYLAAMTIAWGTITCTWFGLPPERLPSFLRNIALPAFSSANPESAGNIKLFCFSIALAQLSIAHVIGVLRNIRSPKALAEVGSLLMLGGMFMVVLNLVVDAERFPLPQAIVWVILGGFVLNFTFANYAGSIVRSIVESLKNFITMFLGVVNVFGDIMSYIRLWAVGLAGSAISATVNSMVGPMFGSFLVFVGVLVLFFGHGLNFVMNILSVIVHGVRLNTLEFSNHLGLTWSGFKYEPFSETGDN
jgi:V/A-type H+-transporting ATPase subunit I